MCSMVEKAQKHIAKLGGLYNDVSNYGSRNVVLTGIIKRILEIEARTRDCAKHTSPSQTLVWAVLPLCSF